MSPKAVHSFCTESQRVRLKVKGKPCRTYTPSCIDGIIPVHYTCCVYTEYNVYRAVLTVLYLYIILAVYILSITYTELY